MTPLGYNLRRCSYSRSCKYWWMTLSVNFVPCGPLLPPWPWPCSPVSALQLQKIWVFLNVVEAIWLLNLAFKSLMNISECVFLSFFLSVAKLCPILATPWTVACQAPLSMGFSRQEYWSGLPFPPPGDLPNPGTKPGSPVLQADSLMTELCGMNVCCCLYRNPSNAQGTVPTGASPSTSTSFQLVLAIP